MIPAPEITPLMIKRLRATGLGYYDINNDIYDKSTDLTDAQARNVRAFILDPTEDQRSHRLSWHRARRYPRD